MSRARALHAAAVAAALLAVPAAVLAQQQDYALPGQQPEPAAAPAPPPLGPKAALRRAAIIDEVRGKVTYRLPNEDRDRALSRPTTVPMQTIVDTTAGRVRLTVARDKAGHTSRGVFHDGRFRLAQGRGARPITHLRLVGELPACGSAMAARATPRRRRLWGNGRGRFRTRGRYSAATVRGTKWLVEDRCDGTLTRVARGEVEVVDFSGSASAPAPESGGDDAQGAPAPQAAPMRRQRRVRLRRGDSFVARPQG